MSAKGIAAKCFFSPFGNLGSFMFGKPDFLEQVPYVLKAYLTQRHFADLGEGICFQRLHPLIIVLGILPSFALLFVNDYGGFTKGRNTSRLFSLHNRSRPASI